ncbi:hypothetical protein CSC74_11535 [Pseudoxanthomonas yeongjuensis]|uniref:DUF4124 domain-containing protein n=1 Tax=Pseudoxanthomonas yeongjuensis TaxID=377616 RepID=UPI001390808A|nr:DUF4124 domain-containing protein [Pseudoxanthomonas yeongjuensis]KAF1716451.1 hypothetical protein CSC74_11535 [Pseudoxanthomonas yeongjuensis]
MKMLCALLLLSMSMSFASAEEVVFYRCTDASGALTLQNMPCPKGDQQEKKVMQSVNTVPMGTASAPPPIPAAAPAATTTTPADAYTPAAAAAASAPTADPGILTSGPVPEVAAIADADRLPPPVLFQCITYDKDSYITEDAEPQSRCVALRTVGLDGNPQGGAGAACEMRRDTCARVADGALCDAWKKRLGETEVAWRFARPGNEQKNKEEFERTRKIWDQSTCGK